MPSMAVSVANVTAAATDIRRESACCWDPPAVRNHNDSLGSETSRPSFLCHDTAFTMSGSNDDTYSWRCPAHCTSTFTMGSTTRHTSCCGVSGSAPDVAIFTSTLTPTSCSRETLPTVSYWRTGQHSWSWLTIIVNCQINSQLNSYVVS